MHSQPANLGARSRWIWLLVLSLLVVNGVTARSAALFISEQESFRAVQAKPPSLPDPPTLLSPPEGSSTCSSMARFTWSRVKQASLYHIQVDNRPIFDSPSIDQTTTNTSHIPESNLASDTYYWRVQASNVDVTGTWSAAWTVILLSPPADATLLYPSDGSRTCDTTPTLEWSTVDSATSYRVQVDDSSHFDSPLVDTSIQGPVYTPERAWTPDIYYWRVQAINDCGGSSWSQTYRLTVLPIPSMPALLTPPAGSSTYDRTPALTWTDADQATSYRIQIDDHAGLGSPIIDQTVASASYTPTNALSNGTYHWRVQALNTCGSSGWADPQNVTIINQPPNANDDYLEVIEDSIDTLLDVLANDSDDNKDPLRIVAVTQPIHGHVEIVGSGAHLAYRPDPDHFGRDSLSYTINDDHGGMDTAWAEITVSGINDPPNAENDLAITDEDTPVTIQVLANDHDGDGHLDPSTVETITGPAHGSTGIDSANGKITYAPALNWNGSDRFVYRVCDDGTPLPAQCDTALVDVTVTEVNDPPVANAGPDQIVHTSTLVTLNGSHSYDPDGDLELEYLWIQDQGPRVNLSNPTVPSPTFTAPHEPCVLVFKLFVIDSLDKLGLTPDYVIITVRKLPVFYTYIPLSAQGYVAAPDLVIQDVTATPNNVRLVISNQGNAPAASEFFVDVYIAPRSAPTAVNQTWDQVGSQGMVWAVTKDVLSKLAPGGSLTLNTGDAYYVEALSSFSGWLPEGTDVYAQVDSFNPDTAYGNVLEAHEVTGGTYNNISGPIRSTSVAAAVARTPESLGDKTP